MNFNKINEGSDCRGAIHCALVPGRFTWSKGAMNCAPTDPKQFVHHHYRPSVALPYLFFIHPSARGSLTHRVRRHHRKATISLHQLIERNRQVADTDARRMINGISDGSDGTNDPHLTNPLGAHRVDVRIVLVDP